MNEPAGSRGPAREKTARTFDALPPAKGSRAPFAESWWGRAWLAALEESSLDTGRLERGRTYARRGAVGRVTVDAGSATAVVQGSRPSPYRSRVRVRQLTDRQWDHLLDVIADRAAHIAALLDGEMPPGLADDAEAAGVTLLPGPRDLDPACNCPDWGIPCKHAAALCYQVARLLDRDPFVLLLLRGRGEHELTDELARRNLSRAAAESAAPPSGAESAGPHSGAGIAGAAAGSSATGPRVPPAGHGEPAAAAFAARAGLPPLPAAPPLPAQAARGPALAGTAASGPGVDPAALELLAADAALRAHHLLAAALDVPRHAVTVPPAPLTEWQDAVRLAATHPATVARIATACRRTPTELAAATRAWHHGGAAALDVLETAWDPPAGHMERAREALRTDWPGETPPPRLRAWRNRWTVAGHGVQLRLSREGLWYPYAKERGAWCPSGPPDADPAVVLAVLLQG